MIRFPDRVPQKVFQFGCNFFLSLNFVRLYKIVILTSKALINKYIYNFKTNLRIRYKTTTKNNIYQHTFVLAII